AHPHDIKNSPLNRPLAPPEKPRQSLLSDPLLSSSPSKIWSFDPQIPAKSGALTPPPASRLIIFESRGVSLPSITTRPPDLPANRELDREGARAFASEKSRRRLPDAPSIPSRR